MTSGLDSGNPLLVVMPSTYLDKLQHLLKHSSSNGDLFIMSKCDHISLCILGTHRSVKTSSCGAAVPNTWTYGLKYIADRPVPSKVEHNRLCVLQSMDKIWKYKIAGVKQLKLRVKPFKTICIQNCIRSDNESH